MRKHACTCQIRLSEKRHAWTPWPLAGRALLAPRWLPVAVNAPGSDSNSLHAAWHGVMGGTAERECALTTLCRAKWCIQPCWFSCTMMASIQGYPVLPWSHAW